MRDYRRRKQLFGSDDQGYPTTSGAVTSANALDDRLEKSCRTAASPRPYRIAVPKPGSHRRRDPSRELPSQEAWSPELLREGDLNNSVRRTGTAWPSIPRTLHLNFP